MLIFYLLFTHKSSRRQKQENLIYDDRCHAPAENRIDNAAAIMAGTPQTIRIPSFLLISIRSVSLSPIIVCIVYISGKIRNLLFFNNKTHSK